MSIERRDGWGCMIMIYNQASILPLSPPPLPPSSSLPSPAFTSHHTCHNHHRSRLWTTSCGSTSCRSRRARAPPRPTSSAAPSTYVRWGGGWMVGDVEWAGLNGYVVFCFHRSIDPPIHAPPPPRTTHQKNMTGAKAQENVRGAAGPAGGAVLQRRPGKQQLRLTEKG